MQLQFWCCSYGIEIRSWARVYILMAWTCAEAAMLTLQCLTNSNYHTLFDFLPPEITTAGEPQSSASILLFGPSFWFYRTANEECVIGLHLIQRKVLRVRHARSDADLDHLL